MSASTMDWFRWYLRVLEGNANPPRYFPEDDE